jgi:tetraacyldisaccharide 4'-kinase
VAVAVGEERIVAIPQLLHDRPETRAILLDDAFQHRAVKAGLNILLTDYSNLFTRDWWLPSGDLRDAPSSYRRAQAIVVTKCPDQLDEEQRRAIAIEIGPRPGQQLFFSTIDYGTPYHITRLDEGVIDDEVEVLLVTGIANPAPLKRWLNDHSRTYFEIAFSDHHIFTIDDLQTITRRFTGITAAKKLILTTEKDAVRLIKFRQELEGWPFYVLPITPRFLFGEEERFADMITQFINEFK